MHSLKKYPIIALFVGLLAGCASAADPGSEPELDTASVAPEQQTESVSICTIGTKTPRVKQPGCCFTTQFGTPYTYKVCVASSVPGGLPSWKTINQCDSPWHATCAQPPPH